VADSPHARYHRQQILPGFGPEGQARLANSHAMIIGLGALGCPAGDLLARAGVGRISLVDRDLVELTNLQRQTLFTESDARASRPKAEAAADRLRAVNSAIRIEPLVEDFAGPDAERMLSAHPRPDVLLDCTDNFDTRYLINDAAVKLGIPLCYGGAVGTSGLSMAIIPGTSPCLRCVFPDPPAPASSPTCDTAGIFSPVSAIIAADQAADAIKILLGRADRLAGSMLSFDLWHNRRQRLDLTTARRADCPCCGLRRFEFLDRAPAREALTLCGRNSVQITPPSRGSAGSSARGGGRAGDIDLPALADRLRAAGHVELSPSSLRLQPVASGDITLTLFPDGRAIIAGTTDPVAAKSLYARYIGG
jgi:molybdopterin/thiamine biosynthesis adenylyltransferase